MDPSSQAPSHLAPRSQTPAGRPVMERRTFIEVLAGGLLAAPLAAEAQQAAKVARVGYLANHVASSPTCQRPFVKDCVTSVTSRAATS